MNGVKGVHENLLTRKDFSFSFEGMPYASQSSDISVLRKYLDMNVNCTFLEIGVYGGRTPLGCYDLFTKNNINYVGIDPWEKCLTVNNIEPKTLLEKGVSQKVLDNRVCNMRFVREVLEDIVKTKSLSHIDLIFDFEENCLDRFEDKSIDLLHLDGAHDTLSVYNELRNWHLKIKEGGMIIGDDFEWETVQKGLDLFLKEHPMSYSDEKGKFILRF